MAITACARFIMMKTRSSLVRSFSLFVFLGAIALNPCASQAKADDDQSQIILLNDSAAALEDSNPGLSKSLAEYADQKEMVLEHKSADINLNSLQSRIKVLNDAALALKTDYPSISRNLYKMAKGLNRTVENAQ